MFRLAEKCETRLTKMKNVRYMSHQAEKGDGDTSNMERTLK